MYGSEGLSFKWLCDLWEGLIRTILPVPGIQIDELMI